MLFLCRKGGKRCYLIDYNIHIVLKGMVDMANDSSLKKLVTKIKNKIINWLHVARYKSIVRNK